MTSDARRVLARSSLQSAGKIRRLPVLETVAAMATWLMPNSALSMCWSCSSSRAAVSMPSRPKGSSSTWLGGRASGRRAIVQHSSGDYQCGSQKQQRVTRVVPSATRRSACRRSCAGRLRSAPAPPGARARGGQGSGVPVGEVALAHRRKHGAQPGHGSCGFAISKGAATVTVTAHRPA